MSNRYSILAIGVAALFMICAVSGALIIASDNNDGTTNDSSSSNRIRSYSSYSSDSVSEKSADTQFYKQKDAYTDGVLELRIAENLGEDKENVNSIFTESQVEQSKVESKEAAIKK